MLAGLHVQCEDGLNADEVLRRRNRFGANALIEKARRSVWSVLLAQLRSIIVILLVVGAALSWMFGHDAEAASIAVVIVINTAIGFFTEWRAIRSVEALRLLGNVETVVRRGGHTRRVSAVELVPGDIVILEAGDVVTADLRLLEASRLQVDESTLTGESMPVDKHTAPLPAGASLADRENMIFKGTALRRGSGEGVVVATGMSTELGRITELVEATGDVTTPLEARLNKLGRVLAGAALGFVLLVVVVGLLAGRDLYALVQMGIALAVATVPEGLPIVATLALARGVWRMARRNALVQALPAVETLGSTCVVVTDKTGTLTENRMRVASIVVAEGERGGPDAFSGPAAEVLRHAVLCNEAPATATEDSSERSVGDPMEIALLVAAGEAGLDPASLRRAAPEVRTEAFDPTERMMATFHRVDDGILVAVKGAPEHVLAVCTAERVGSAIRPLSPERRSWWQAQAEHLAGRGYRVLAVASKNTTHTRENPYGGLTLTGVVGFMDPPRTGARESIDACRRAGIRVVMVTGDHATTALHIGRAVGLVRDGDVDDVVTGTELEDVDGLSPERRRRLLDAPVFARTSPEQKLNLLELYQRDGQVTAMIGDGVNDGPALRKADIGIAMGQRGTQVAREAAAMVLQDDRFETIAVAVEQGRVIYDNIRKFVVYLISCNLSEIFTIGVATLLDAPLPILPLQVLYLNLVTDVFPALALGVGEGHAGIMERPPRDPAEAFLARRHWTRIFGFSLVLTAPVLIALGVALGVLHFPPARAVTVSFMVLAFAQLFHVFNMADRAAGAWVNEVTRNRWVWGALLLCTALLLAAVYLPGLSDILGTVDPGPRGWVLALGLAASPLVVGRALHIVRRGVWNLHPEGTHA